MTITNNDTFHSLWHTSALPERATMQWIMLDHQKRKRHLWPRYRVARNTACDIFTPVVERISAALVKTSTRRRGNLRVRGEGRRRLASRDGASLQSRALRQARAVRRLPGETAHVGGCVCPRVAGAAQLIAAVSAPRYRGAPCAQPRAGPCAVGRDWARALALAARRAGSARAMQGTDARGWWIVDVAAERGGAAAGLGVARNDELHVEWPQSVSSIAASRPCLLSCPVHCTVRSLPARPPARPPRSVVL